MHKNECALRCRRRELRSTAVDIGRPYDSLRELTWRDWRPSYGAALRIPWNLATVVTIDYGVSAEDTGLYVNFNHIF